MKTGPKITRPAAAAALPGLAKTNSATAWESEMFKMTTFFSLKRMLHIEKTRIRVFGCSKHLKTTRCLNEIGSDRSARRGRETLRNPILFTYF